MISIIFFVLLSLVGLVYLLYSQKNKNDILTETIQELKEIQEIKEIKAYLAGRDEERVRIAEDWHDGIGNSLSTLRLIADTIQPKNPERYHEALSLLEHTQREFRQIIDNELVNDFSDKAAIIRVFEKWVQQLQFGNIMFVFKVYDLKLYKKCQPIFKSHLYRIVQELLANTIKHANASRISIEFREEKAQLSLTIKDNGIGLKEQLGKKTLLRSVNRRLILLEGTMQIGETISTNGTVIQLMLPLKLF
ncbi:MAG: sensor histidine kinase [Saprospiraceae bacterium]